MWLCVLGTWLAPVELTVTGDGFVYFPSAVCLKDALNHLAFTMWQEAGGEFFSLVSEHVCIEYFWLSKVFSALACYPLFPPLLPSPLLFFSPSPYIGHLFSAFRTALIITMDKFDHPQENSYPQTLLLTFWFLFVLSVGLCYLFVCSLITLMNSSALRRSVTCVGICLQKIIQASSTFMNPQNVFGRLQWLHLCSVPMIFDRNFPMPARNSDWFLSPQTFISFTL